MRAVAVVAFLALMLVFWAVGGRLARALGLRFDDPAEEFGVAVALSLGTLTLAVFLLAVLHAITWVSILAVVAIPAVFSLGECRTKVIRAVAWLRGLRGKSLSLWKSGVKGRLAGLTTAFYGLGLIVALAPPTGIDAGVYHFTIPKVIVQAGGLVPRDDIWIHKFGGFYMVYVVGMALGGEILAKLLAFGASVAAATLAFAAAERVRAGAGWAAAFLLSSTPLFVGFTGYENLEPPIVMYLLAGTLGLLRYEAGGRARWLLAACAWSGFAVGAKPSAFPVAVLLLAAVILMIARERRRALPLVAAGIALFAATSAFWGLWNLATTGAFVYRYPGTALSDDPRSRSSPVWIAGGILATLRYLVTVGAYWTESAGPFVIAGVAGSALFLRKAAKLPLVLFASGVVVYIATLIVFSPGHLWSEFGGRYVAPATVGFGVLAAAPFVCWAFEQGGVFRAAVLAALFLPAVPLGILKAGKAAVAAPAAFGIESRSAYLAKKIETFAACEALNRLPDPDVRVLFVAYRPYYLDRPFIHASRPESPFYLGLRGREDFIRRARQLRVTHVLYEPQPPQTPWLADAESFFGSAPFREIGRWPPGATRAVRLYEVGRD